MTASNKLKYDCASKNETCRGIGTSKDKHHNYPYFNFFSFLFYIGKLQMYPMGFEPTTSPCTLLLQGEEIPFELELIGVND